MGSSGGYLRSTHTSLLSRVRDTGDHAAWREFEGRYRELLLRFCCRRGLQPADAEDLTQAVFVNLSKTLPEFAYDPKRGRFRDYLFSAIRNAIGRWAGRASRNVMQLGSSATHALPLETPFDDRETAEPPIMGGRVDAAPLPAGDGHGAADF